MSYRIMGLDPKHFSPLFGLNDDELARRRMMRVSADSVPGYPCRVSLEDAQIGESLLLLNYEHLPGNTPYRSAHAIFVREIAHEAFECVDVIPSALSCRPLSIRSFDDRGMMLDADLIGGEHAAGLIEQLFQNPQAAYLHVHYAKRGCYAARVERV